jgi:hypothetical protein
VEFSAQLIERKAGRSSGVQTVTMQETMGSSFRSRKGEYSPCHGVSDDPFDRGEDDEITKRDADERHRGLKGSIDGILMKRGV